jgi:hypothetical protein
VLSLARVSRGLFSAQVGAVRPYADEHHTGHGAPLGQDRVEVDFCFTDRAGVAHFNWETKYVLRVELALPVVNNRIFSTGHGFRLIGPGASCIALLSSSEIERLYRERGLTCFDPNEVPC